MREPLLALGILVLVGATLWLWLASRQSRARRAGAPDLVETYHARGAGALVLAIRDAGSGSFAYNPPAGKTLGIGSTLVVLGSVEMMEHLRKLV